MRTSVESAMEDSPRREIPCAPVLGTLQALPLMGPASSASEHHHTL